ncbi:23541_t:CDS:2, partial [Cetraspora pellucida]
QGSDPVGRFYSKLRKLARLAGINEQQIRLQFIHGISPDNQLEIRRIGINRPVSELLTELEEIERYKTEQLSGAYSIPKSAIEHQQQFYSNADINKLVEERIASREKQSLASEKHIFEAKPKQVSQVDSNTEAIRQFIEIMKRAKKTLAKKPGPGKEKINQTKIAKAIKNISSKSKSFRRKTKLKSRSKTQKKKSSTRSKHVNAYIISDESSLESSSSENDNTTFSENELETNTLLYSQSKSESSESSESESSNSESDSDKYEVNATKKKISFSNTKSSKKRKSARPKTSSKKSSNTSSDKKSSKDIRLLKIPTDNISLNAFFAILRSMVDSFTRTQPKEVSINGYNMINAEFIALKDPQTNIPPKTALEEMQPEAEISWPNPIEINFIRKIIPNDVATITCQITSPSGKNIQVPGALIDSGANCSLKSKGLAKLLGMNIDKNKKPSVKWRNNSLESIGTCYN